MPLTGRISVWLVAGALLGVGVLVYRITQTRVDGEMHLLRVRELESAHIDPSVHRLLEQTATGASRSPRRAEVHAEFAHACHANGLAELAQPAYEQAIRLASKQQRAVLWHQLALLLAEQGQVDSALKCMQQSVNLNDAHAPSHWQRGFWLLDDDDATNAQSAFDRALHIDPASIPAQVGVARIHMQRGDYHQAVQRLQPLLARAIASSQETYIRQLLGAAQRNLGQISECRSHLLQVRGAHVTWSNPWRDEIYRLRTGYRALLEDAESLIALKRYQDAATLLERALRERPHDEVLLNNLAVAKVGLDQREAAIALLLQALQLAPDSFLTHLNISNVHESENLAYSLRHAQQAAKINPQSAAAHFQIARVLILLNRPQEALQPLEHAVHLGTNDTATRIMLAQLLLQLEQPARAERVALQALDGAPNESSAFVVIGRVKAEQGQFEDASRLLQRARQLNPNDATLAPAIRRLQELQRAGPQTPSR